MQTCRVCLSPDVAQIDEQIQQGRPLAILVQEWRIPRSTLAKHRGHSIMQAGTFDRSAAGAHFLSVLNKRLELGYQKAVRWKSARLYADCLRQHTLIVQLLLTGQPAEPEVPAAQRPHERLPKLDVRKTAELILQTVPPE